MKHKFAAALSLFMAVCALAGCSRGEESGSLNIVDVGGASVSASSGGAIFSGSREEQSFFSRSSSESLVSSPYEESSSAFSESSGSVLQSSELPVSSASSKPDSSGSTSSSSVSSSSQSTPKSTSSVSSPRSSSSKSTSSSKSSTPSVPQVNPSGANSYKTLNYNEVRGVWISYIELASLPSSSESVFRNAVGGVFDNCKALGLNTVYVHTRSHGDAYYSSRLFPYTKYISGGFDALSVMVDEAHKRGLSFQAWINPLRGCSAADAARENGYPMGDWIGGGTRAVNINGYYYLNPAYDEVIKLIADGAYEIVSNYDVDGLHIDDYFYPTTDASFDSAAFNSSSYSTLSAFRFANCDKMVSSLYSAVKRGNPNAVFGVSCQGNLSNNYNNLYADVKKWCSNGGYLDYIMPQIYFGFKNSAQPYAECVKTWNNIASGGKIPLIVGLSVYKIGTEDAWAGAGITEWITDGGILKRQFSEAYELPAYGGICLYSYQSIFSPSAAVKSQVDEEISLLKSAMNNT